MVSAVGGWYYCEEREYSVGGFGMCKSPARVGHGALEPGQLPEGHGEQDRAMPLSWQRRHGNNAVLRWLPSNL